jgi:hypothetical protein
MATVKRMVELALVVVAGGCSNLQGFGGPVPPLATFHVEVTGDLGPLRPPGETGTPDLQVAMVWGQQFLVEPLCILPPETPEAAAVYAVGCRDPFGFVPARVAANAPIDFGVPASLDLFTLPGADVMVGDVTARVAYASFLIYDDRDHSGTLELARPNRPQMNDGPPMNDTTPIHLTDTVYGASFLTMTAPDQRAAFREGAFSAVAAFYPRAGCGEPPPAFSVLAAGGFTVLDAIKATMAGTLPQEDPAACAQADPADAVITIPVQAPAMVREAACTERSTNSSVRYREPDAMSPDLTDRKLACVHLPSFGTPSDITELVVSARSDDSCFGLTHYVLKGCREDPACGTPDWDHSLAPPTWWPCPP